MRMRRRGFRWCVCIALFKKKNNNKKKIKKKINKKK